MMEFLFKIMILVLVFLFIFIFSSKTRTWLKGYGACDNLGLICFRKAIPRSDYKSLSSDEVEWYCDKHYDECNHIRRKVQSMLKEYDKAQQNLGSVEDKE